MASSSPWSSISSSVSRDSAPSDSTSATDSTLSLSPPSCDGELRVLVALVALNVLRRCDARRSQPSEVLVAHAKRLVALTLGGLLLPDDCDPASRGQQHQLKHRSMGGVCRAVLRDLRRNVCSSRSLLLSMILLQDPAVDAAFVKAVQSHLMLGDSGHQQGGDNTKNSRGSSRISFSSARRRLDDFLESLNITLTTLFL